MPRPTFPLIAVLAAFLAVQSRAVFAEPDYARFLGDYQGHAQIGDDHRDMSVRIRAVKDGFEVNWKSVSHKSGGRVSEKEYTIPFRASGRAGIYASAMGVNIFGNPAPLDPMKGDPYVWARISGGTLTVFSLLIDSDGGYEMQQYNRTLAPGGLQLEYERIRNGEKLKRIRTFLQKAE